MRVGFLVLALLPAPELAADISPTLLADRTELRLSESLQLTLAIEGPGPLRVELPQELLDDASAANWRLRPAGPATLTDLPGGRQRWVQVYRADPYVAGEAVPIGFTAINVFLAGNAQPTRVVLEPLTAQVTTGVKGDLSELRPPTGIEELPTPPSAIGPWERAAGLALALAVVMGIGILVWQMTGRRRPVPLSPDAWAARELDALERTAPDVGVFAERLSHVVRTYLERSSGIPATRLTTSEFLLALESNEAGVIPVDPVRSILEWCDRVKFAGSLSSEEERAQRLVEARSLLLSPVTADG